ncbi:MAG: HAD-IIB family hydrolase, partial [Candidatus Riflebacteria bacterium]|nr:HAD-IIB family hydrolase [Candidatus Riflebacteria bacterium]
MSIRLFCADLDGTLVGNPESSRRFRIAWEGLEEGRGPLLCYNTGRLVDDAMSLIGHEGLPVPDYVIGGIGTQIHAPRLERPVPELGRSWASGWDLERIEQVLLGFPGVIRQPPRHLHPYKSSWYLHRATDETVADLRQQLARAGLAVTVVYSSMRDLDVLPLDTDKGKALQRLCEHLDIPLHAVLVAGDSGNDISMFLLPGVRGSVVENAQPELHGAVVGRPTFTA